MGSTGRNILIGCAAAIGVAALLGVGSCIGFTVWLNRPGHLMEPEKLLGADTSGFIEWTLRREDPGTLAVLEALMDNLQQERRSRSPLPGWLDSIIAEGH